MEEATAQYHRDVPANPAAVEYLSQTRALSRDSAISFRLGVVDNPLPGHEQYRGRLCIPYLTAAGVTTLRFRRIGDGDGPKYLSMPGDPSRIFNANALLAHTDEIAICEGEIDAITAQQCGINAVGFAGVSAFQGYMARVFKGYRRVWILRDSDDKGQGQEFAEKLAARIDNALIIPMPDGDDVNSLVARDGPTALLERIRK